MEDLIAVARVLIALVFYTAAYILPPALVLVAALRLAFRWTANWRLMVAALLAALPQTYLIATGSPLTVVFFISTALTVGAAILYILTTRGHRSGIKPLLDIALVSIVLVYQVMNVGWIVG